MKKLVPIVLAALVASALPAPAATPVTWTADLVHSRAEFTVSHLIVSKVLGHIPIAALTLVTAPNSVMPQEVAATLDVAHEDTDNHTRDEDLRSATYFDVAHYPTLTFRSTKIVPSGPADAIVTGDLTIKNVTKTVSFPMHVDGRVPDHDGTLVGYSGQLHIDRRDFDMVDKSLTPAGILLVGYDVAIGLTVVASTPDGGVRANTH